MNVSEEVFCHVIYIINAMLTYWPKKRKNTHHLVALCPGLPGCAGTRRNIHPLTPILIIKHSINFLHLLRDIASSLFNLRAWQSFFTTSLQVLFSLSFGIEPSTSYSIHFFAQSLSFFRNTCPHRHNLFCCSTEITSSIPNLFLS